MFKSVLQYDFSSDPMSVKWIPPTRYTPGYNPGRTKIDKK